MGASVAQLVLCTFCLFPQQLLLKEAFSVSVKYTHKKNPQPTNQLKKKKRDNQQKPNKKKHQKHPPYIF